MVSFVQKISPRQIVVFLLIAGVIIIGILPRVFQTGSVLLDKYLGDALYAILFYLLVGLAWPKGNPLQKMILTVLGMLIIESFQLTGLPLQWRLSSNRLLNFISIVLGTGFSWLDIVAYLAGIVIIWRVDEQWMSRLK